MRRLFFDVNVVLDLLLAREPWIEHVRPLADAVLAGRVEGYVSSASFPIVYYIVRRQSDARNARACVERCIATFVIASVDRDVIRESFALHGLDYEDDVQIACALAVAADLIVTRDPAGFRHSPIEALAPAEAASRIAAIV